MDAVMRSRRTMVLLMLAIFLLGAATGGFAMRAAQQRRLRALLEADPVEVRQDLFLRALDAKLELDARQRQVVSETLDQQRDRYRAAINQARPTIRILRNEVVEALRPTLDAEQRSALEALLRTRDAKP
jgi:hypothetical protein